MKNLIIVEGQNLFVSFSSIQEHSNVNYEVLKRSIKNNIGMLIDNGLVYPYESSEDLLYSEMMFSDRSSVLLMGLLPNDENTIMFKEELISQIFDIKEEIIRVNNIKTEALLEQAEKEKLIAVAEAKKCKIYSDGTMSVRGVIQHLGLDVSEDFAWDALTYAGFNEDITKVTKYRRIPDGVPSYIGTPRGTQSPTYYPQVVKQAILDYIEQVK